MGVNTIFIFMAINKTIRLAIILVTITLMVQECGNKIGLDCATTKYSFELPVKAYPDRDSISIGDTIWFEVNAPTRLKDINTNQMVDYSGTANLGSALSFSALSADNEFTINSVERFNYVLINGLELRHSYNNGLGNEYQFIENNSSYIFQLGIIAKEKGKYRIVFSNSNNTYRNSDKCTKASFNINFKNTNQHYTLSPFYIIGTNPVGGDYYLVVK